MKARLITNLVVLNISLWRQTFLDAHESEPAGLIISFSFFSPAREASDVFD
jgi:hypothetical protein